MPPRGLANPLLAAPRRETARETTMAYSAPAGAEDVAITRPGYDPELGGSGSRPLIIVPSLRMSSFGIVFGGMP